jgi:hypothetical protein
MLGTMFGRHRILIAISLLFSVCGCAAPSGHDASNVALAHRIDAALNRATDFLISRQSPDGAWRSTVYGFYKDGPTLTPHVAFELQQIAVASDSKDHAESLAANYLVRLTSDDDVLSKDLIYPVYTAADTVRILSHRDSPAVMSARAAYLALLRSHQLTASNGWEPSDPEFGGWSYALVPPHRPINGLPRGPWDWSNLSATRYAVDALLASGVATDDPALRAALVCVERCQNFPQDQPSADPKFDDGGFFFVPADEIHNKAGVAGNDVHGRQRYHSYGSATVDGIHAMLACGLERSNPRVIAGLDWLARHGDIGHNPGDFIAANEDIRDATYFYYCRGLAQLYLSGCDAQLDAMVRKTGGAPKLAQVLLSRQRPDGSWSNSFTDAKEDDPLIATPLAAEALWRCRQAIVQLPLN